jgi:hypothetical protein
MREHRYASRCSWRGSTAAGYEAYDRGHEASAPPAEATLRLASDPAFRGDPRLLNPEQLVVLAASSWRSRRGPGSTCWSTTTRPRA